MKDIINYKGYSATVSYSATDDVLFGKVLGINDLVSFEGASVKELKKAFKEAIEDYLETCEILAKEPEKRYKGSFNVRIPSEMHKQAVLYASIRGVSLNDFLKTAIGFTLQHKDELDNVGTLH